MRIIWMLALSLFYSCSAEEKNQGLIEKFEGIMQDEAANTFGFASYFQNNMVLQMEPHSAVIWGYGTVGATVNISVDVQTVYSTKVQEGFDKRGIWSVKIKPHSAGSTADFQGVHDYFGQLQWILLKNILFGDVFVCSGQSNMQFTMSMAFNSTEELKDTVNYPNIRVFTVSENYSETPLRDVAQIELPWSVPSPETVGGKPWTYFSAVCWLYGKYLYDEMKVPIGLVATTWGGTPVEAWSPPAVFDVCKESKSANVHNNVHGLKKLDSINGPHDNSQLWNAMIYPLLNMTIKGVLWYQGEANTGYHANSYQCMFPNMIRTWRKEWFRGSQMTTDPVFPFGFVQLCDDTSSSGNFPLVRWHQTADYGFAPNPDMEETFMAVAMDLPDNDSPYSGIHPRDKQDVAARLVAGALSVVYHRTLIFDGPFPEKIFETADHKVVIEYSKYQQLSVEDRGNFQICCAGQSCDVTDPEDSPAWSTAAIASSTDHTVTLDAWKCSKDFAFVEKVRYAWALTPCEFKKCSVYNTLGFPAAPFYLECVSK